MHDELCQKLCQHNLSKPRNCVGGSSGVKEATHKTCQFPTPETIRGMECMGVQAFEETISGSRQKSIAYDWSMVALNTIDQS